MRKQLKSLLLVVLFAGICIPVWGQATPSTEGRDFWVTFLQAQTDSPELILTISAKEACDVVIENTKANYQVNRSVAANSSTQVTINNRSAAYSSTSEQATYTALHVTATKDISLFAGNYITKTFDAANILPTTALLDDYIVQTYPPSDHDGDASSRGSHFAIVATEDNTVVDYVLTAKTSGGRTGAQTTPTLNKGQVYYVWTGKGAGDVADLSGTTVKARDGKKIAVFQGCPHTNIPYMVEDRDHIFSQAMPTAYWGSEFAISASCNHRRDIITVMAINDGTDVYINAEDGGKILVHTFDFTKDKKHYWTFEIGEEVAYSTSNDSPLYPKGLLPPPLVVDSSCYLTTSCPVGVHLFMVSNRYDVETAGGSSLADPAMLWISPIEQVIKEINFSTYDKGTTLHFLNVVTTTANVPFMTLDGTSIQQHFHPVTGNNDYSFARFAITAGNHNLQGTTGFLAHVYGYGERESYAYSCGSSTVQRSVTFNGEPLMIDALSSTTFCVNDEIEMKLNIGNNNYESVVWDFGDGSSYAAPSYVSNEEKKVTSHKYIVPGWYDLVVSMVYVNACTKEEHSEDMRFSFRVVRPDTIRRVDPGLCLEENDPRSGIIIDTMTYDCDSIVITQSLVRHKSSYEYPLTAKDVAIINGTEYRNSQDVTWTIANREGCDSTITCHLTVIKCLDLQIVNEPALQHVCAGETYELPFSYDKDGLPGDAYLVVNGKKYPLNIAGTSLDVTGTRYEGFITLPIDQCTPGYYSAKVQINDINCDTIAESPELTLSVYYPQKVFALKFNNVLALYNKDYNGGYDFVGYQWYKNGNPIAGATSAVYRTEDPFTVGDVYHVVLTDNKGVTLPACGLEITEEGQENYSPANAPAATKKIINRHMYIMKDGLVYDIYGQRVK